LVISLSKYFNLNQTLSLKNFNFILISFNS
jgi:hypothetical protein